jgi:hypothetical protein
MCPQKRKVLKTNFKKIPQMCPPRKKNQIKKKRNNFTFIIGVGP